MTKKEVKVLWDWWYDQGWADAVNDSEYSPPIFEEDFAPAYAAGFRDGVISEDLY